MQQPTEPPVPDIREYLRVLRRRKWAVVLVTAVTVAAAMAFSIRQTPIYASTAKVLVRPPTANQSLQGVPATSLVSMDTEQQLVRSEDVAMLAAWIEAAGGEEVLKKVTEAAATGAAATPPDVTGSDATRLLSHVSISVPANTLILEVTFSDPDPAVAQKGAQSFADAYIVYKAGQLRQAYYNVTAPIQERIKTLQGKLTKARARLASAAPGSPEAQRAQTVIDSVPSQIAIYQSQIGSLPALDVPGVVVQRADLPTSPASPNFVLNGALALVLGLALGVGLAFLRERLDDRLAGREELAEAVGAPVLAVVPKVAGWRKRDQTAMPALDTPKGAAAEAYRTIRTNLQFISRGDLKVIAFTSPAAGEGKTTTAANLAVSLAQTGKRVIALSADLRKPRLHRFFDASNNVGVSNILARQVTAFDAVQRVGLDKLRLVASGPIPPNPAELLESADMDALLDQLRRAADYVILDTAPVLAVSDTLILAPKCDALIAVADASSTARGAVQHLREQIEQVGGNIIGCVFNNFDAARAKYYSSYYHRDYYYSYGRREAEEKAIPRGDGRDRTGLESIQLEDVGPAAGPQPPEDLWERVEDLWR